MDVRHSEIFNALDASSSPTMSATGARTFRIISPHQSLGTFLRSITIWNNVISSVNECFSSLSWYLMPSHHQSMCNLYSTNAMYASTASSSQQCQVSAKSASSFKVNVARERYSGRHGTVCGPAPRPAPAPTRLSMVQVCHS